MLPAHDLETFLITVEEAVDRARTGEVAGGYEALLAGVQHAEQTAGAPWAPELAARYRAALDRYATRCSVGRP
jgi:hypothetical protein